MQETLRTRKETRNVTGVDLFNIVYQSVLIWMSIQSMVF